MFATGADPVALGLVASMSRPGGNITGVTPFTRQLGPKQLGLLQALIPKASVIAVLVNRNQLDSADELKAIQEAVAAITDTLFAVVEHRLRCSAGWCNRADCGG